MKIFRDNKSRAASIPRRAALPAGRGPRWSFTAILIPGLLRTALLTVSLLMAGLASPIAVQAQQEKEPEARRITPNLGLVPLPERRRDPASGDPQALQPGPYMGLETERRPADPPKDPAATGPKEPETPPTDPAGGGKGIEENILRSPDPASLGILEAADGGFPADLWLGARRPVLEKLLVLMPVGTLSPTVNALGGRLLLTSAPVPRAESGGDESRLLEAKVIAVAGLGHLEQLNAYLEGLPSENITGTVRRIKAEALLLDGDMRAACDVARLGRIEEGSAFWLKLEALCLAIAGNSAGAALNIGLLEESNEVSLRFAMLIDEVSFQKEGGAPDPSAPPATEVFRAGELDALMVALVSAAGRKIEVEAVQSLPLLVQATLALSGDLELDLRADLAELAAARGAIPGAALGDIFLGMAFTEGEKNSVELLAETDLGARVDGLIYFMILEAGDEPRQLELLRLGWERVLRQQKQSALGPIYADLAAGFRANPSLVNFAPLAGRILIYAGRIDEARVWYDMLAGLAIQGEAAATASLVELWPLLLIAESNEATAYSDGFLDLWRQGVSVLPADQQLSRAGLFYSLLETFGHPVSERAWEDVLAKPATESGQAPHYGLWRQLLLSARAKRLGETVTLSLTTIGAEGPDGTSITALTAALRSLKGAGLEAEARALAVERMVAAGF